MEQIIILYTAWIISKEQLINASIVYYDIYQKEKRTKNVEEILDRTWHREYIRNEFENSKYTYTLPL